MLHPPHIERPRNSFKSVFFIKWLRLHLASQPYFFGFKFFYLFNHKFNKPPTDTLPTIFFLCHHPFNFYFTFSNFPESGCCNNLIISHCYKMSGNFIIFIRFPSRLETLFYDEHINPKSNRINKFTNYFYFFIFHIHIIPSSQQAEHALKPSFQFHSIQLKAPLHQCPCRPQAPLLQAPQQMRPLQIRPFPLAPFSRPPGASALLR